MRLLATLTLLALVSPSSWPVQAQKAGSEEKPIKISTELVQLDVVVTDKKGNVVPNLGKQDFEVYENGKKQAVSFLEFVNAGRNQAQAGNQGQTGKQPERPARPQGPGTGDVRRTFGFVVDDLTIRWEDLVYIRQMLLNFVDNQMQAGDLVAIVRTIGGKGLLQQFTSDKEILRRAIALLTPRSHPLQQYNNPATERVESRPAPLSDGGEDVLGGIDVRTGGPTDPASPSENTNLVLRAQMSIGTAGFVIESMKQLPGRKSLVLISSGLPVFGPQANPEAANVVSVLNLLADQATRAGVSIHTMDVQGLAAYRAVATFEETPGKSMLGADRGGAPTALNPNPRNSFGRTADESLLGADPISYQQGLRVLSSATGGLAVLKKNDFNEGLDAIVRANDGYYLVAYTPSDGKFDNKFRRVEVKVKGDDYRVYSRRGYFAREEKPPAVPTTKQEQLLAAIKSPLARLQVNLDALLLYKATAEKQGSLDIHLSIDPRKLAFEDATDGKQATYDVAGFVFDELGKIRGGFSETLTAKLSADGLKKAESAGISYSADTKLPPGAYQIRLAVRDNRTGNIGTLSRFVEIPDLTKGKFAASSLLLGSAPAGDTKALNPIPVTANRQISQKQDLRYAVFIYNPKLKDGKPLVRSEVTISQGEKTLFTEPEEAVQVSPTKGQLMKWGQIGLTGVKPGRYTLTLKITDPLADKAYQTIVRSMDFVVVE